MISILDIVECTTVDGPGFRTSIYCAGCKHKCLGCHNPESWDKKNGTKYSVDEIFERLIEDPISNITFTGGDPFYQSKEFAKLAKRIKTETKKNIWCYTGFMFEALVGNELLNWIDVLVDGPFIQSLKTKDLPFVGSSNQRIIDVKKSLLSGKVELFDLDLSVNY